MSAELHPLIDEAIRAIPLADEATIAETAVIALRWAAGQLGRGIGDRHARGFLWYEADEIERGIERP